MNIFVPQFSQRRILIDKFLCKSCVTHQKKMNDRKSHQGFDFIDLLINFATCCENPPKFITTYLLLLLSFKMRIVLECINEKREQSIVDFFFPEKFCYAIQGKLCISMQISPPAAACRWGPKLAQFLSLPNLKTIFLVVLSMTSLDDTHTMQSEKLKCL